MQNEASLYGKLIEEVCKGLKGSGGHLFEVNAPIVARRERDKTTKHSNQYWR
jgi:hypothetical protein